MSIVSVSRPELADNRQQIFVDSIKVLNNVQPSAYSPLDKVYIDNVLENVGAIEALNSARPTAVVTGALQAAVPLVIAIPNADNSERLEFALLINPASWNQGKTSSVQSSYTRTGFITQAWGPQQDLVTSNGKTAAFMVQGIGLTNSARRRSVAYANFLAFLYVYRNNGYLYSDLSKLSSNLTRVIGKTVGVELYYDTQYFMGHFNNFSVEESAETPFLFNYNFEFVVSTLSRNFNEVRGHFEPLSSKGSAFIKPTKQPPTEIQILGDLEDLNQSELEGLNISSSSEGIIS